MAYLDSVGAALYTQEQLKAVFDDLASLKLGNPHSRNSASQLSGDLVDQVRFRILDHFNVRHDEYSVIFTSGATAALKLVAECFDFGTRNLMQKEEDRKLFSQRPRTGPCFGYLKDNHTSVVGMREIISPGIPIVCLEERNCLSPEEFTQERNSVRSLFVYPPESNFNGKKYPLSWIEEAHSGRVLPGECFVCLDAACFAGTNELNLAIFKPDFVAVSFYKIFGYPTGTGALLVRNSSAHVLKKRYFGGGTVKVSLPSQPFYKGKENLGERFEDGTINYLSIIALKHGFDAVAKKGGMKKISEQQFELAKFTFEILSTMKHKNDSPVAEIYCSPQKFSNPDSQGPIITFNLLKPDGSFVGFTEVEKMSDLYSVQLRTGCFCNQGACQINLILSDADVINNFESGKECGDKTDLVDGKPVGAVRISFGWTSVKQDAMIFLSMIHDCFTDQPTYSFSDLTGQPVIARPPISSRIKNDRTASGLHLTDIFIYPLKSARGIRAQEWSLSRTGFKFDRMWMVADKNGLCLTLKRAPGLSQIQPEFEDDGIKLSLEGCNPLALHPDDTPGQATCQNKICTDRVDTRICSEAANDWISAGLGVPSCVLLKQDASMSRQSQEDPNKLVSLANVAQYLLINRASVRRLLPLVQSAVPHIDEQDLVLRFRANLVVDGIEPGEEDTWSSVKIGNTIFKVTGKCQRCQMICINQETGEKDARILTALRDVNQGKMTFGIYLETDAADGKISTLDQHGYGKPLAFNTGIEEVRSYTHLLLPYTSLTEPSLFSQAITGEFLQQKHDHISRASLVFKPNQALA